MEERGGKQIRWNKGEKMSIKKGKEIHQRKRIRDKVEEGREGRREER